MSPTIIDSDGIVIHSPYEETNLHASEYFEKGGGLVSLTELARDLPIASSEDSASSSEEEYGSPSLAYDSGYLPGENSINDVKKEDEETTKLHTLTAAIRVMISCVGDNPEREGLLKTPERYAKALLSFTQGYHTTVAEVVNDAVFHEDGCNDIVIVKDIEVFSLCEHHLVPFFGRIHVGYIPNGSVLGLSKIARIVEVFARRLQIQERLTRQVALAIEDVLHPQGVAVIMESSHLCMVMRGVQKTSSSTTTSCMLGSLKNQSELRHEFLSLVKGK